MANKAAPPSKGRKVTSWVPGAGIDREVISTDICRYLGNDATVRPGNFKDPITGDEGSGFYITAYRTLTTEQLADIKADSLRWQAESGNVRNGQSPGAASPQGLEINARRPNVAPDNYRSSNIRSKQYDNNQPQESMHDVLPNPRIPQGRGMPPYDGQSPSQFGPPGIRDPRDIRDPYDTRDPRDLRGIDLREPRDPRDPRDPRTIRDPRDARDPRDPRDIRDPHLRDLRPDSRDPYAGQTIAEVPFAADRRGEPQFFVNGRGQAPGFDMPPSRIPGQPSYPPNYNNQFTNLPPGIPQMPYNGREPQVDRGMRDVPMVDYYDDEYAGQNTMPEPYRGPSRPVREPDNQRDTEARHRDRRPRH